MDFDFTGPTTKPSTPMERLVIVWSLILLLLAFGSVCLYFGFTAPPAKAIQAAQVRLWGYGFVAAAVCVWLLHRLVKWLLD